MPGANRTKHLQGLHVWMKSMIPPLVERSVPVLSMSEDGVCWDQQFCAYSASLKNTELTTRMTGAVHRRRSH